MRKLKSAAPDDLLGSLIKGREEILQNAKQKESEAMLVGRYVGYVLELEQSVRAYIESVSTESAQKVRYRGSAERYSVLATPRILLEDKTVNNKGLELTAQLEHISQYRLLRKKTPAVERLGITYRAGERVVRSVFGDVGNAYIYARSNSPIAYSLVHEDVWFQNDKPDEACKSFGVGRYVADLRQLNALGVVAIELPKDWRVHE